MPNPDTAFALPDRLHAKRDPALIATDEQFFATMGASLERAITELEVQLAAQLKAPGGQGQAALERDLEIHRLGGRLRALQRYGLDLCLGRIVETGIRQPVYIGRLGLTDSDGERLLVDWRSPAAEPFFGATHANPMGLESRRRYRWTGGRVTDYWDEVFTPEGLEGRAALDDQSAFIASLGSSRSPRMRDVLGTIQADQDAIIRAGSPGVLVVDGGPGTGKTVVALHRAAYLLHSDPRLSRSRGGVLFVGPTPTYLSYVDDVLPSLGEEGVQICTLRGLVAEGPTATRESDPTAAALKESARLLKAVENAVRHYETPPTEGRTVETAWADVWLDVADWTEAFDAAEPGSTHNEARDQVWEHLLEILGDKLDGIPEAVHVLRQDDELRAAFNRAWPLLDPVGVVADLWSVPAYLRRCAPWLDDAEVAALQRDEPRAWTVEDLPYLDAARQHIGDPEDSRRAHQREAVIAAEQEQYARVIDHLIEDDDSELHLMSMLRGQDFQNSLVDETTLPAADPDALAGPFAHIIVDEAQELTDAQWRMLVSRCPSRSFTIVGDRAQARRGFTETWAERLARIGLGPISVATLRINYRTPAEVMAEAEPVIRAVIPEANVPTSVRSSGLAVEHASTTELEPLLAAWLAAHYEGVAAVIGDPAFSPTPRVRSLTAEGVKGLEFDLVVLVEPEKVESGNDPENSSGGIEAAVDRYVAMTRATQQLIVLSPPGRV